MIFRLIFRKNKVGKSVNFFDQNYGLSPLNKKLFLATFKEGHFYSLERVVLHLEHQKTVSQGLLCVKRKSVFIHLAHQKMIF